MEFNDSLTKKQAFYAVASKESLVEHKAKIFYNRPPYYMKFLNSWTTRRERENESSGN